MVQIYQQTDGQTRLSANFRVREFACKCGRCKQVLIDDALVAQLQAIRDHFKAAVNINSGYRCREQNEKVGGDPNSSHMQGMAADIVVKGVHPKEVAKYAESIGVQRIGLYDSFVHIGSGSKRLFWVNKNTNQVESFGAVQSFSIELPVLRRGSRGDGVKALQANLRGMDYDICVDGSFGPATETAVKAYQKKCNLPTHGIVDQVTCMTMLGVQER